MSSRILTCLASCCRGAVAQCCASQLLASLGSQGCPYLLCKRRSLCFRCTVSGYQEVDYAIAIQSS